MGKGRRRHQEAPHIQPVDVDGVRTVSVLTVLWAVGFVVLAFNRQQLEEEGLGWLLWTCLAGVGLGLLGLEYTRKRREAIALAQLEEEADEDLEEDFSAETDGAHEGVVESDDDVSEPYGDRPSEHETRRIAPAARTDPPVGRPDMPAARPDVPPETSAHGDTGPGPASDAIPTKPIQRASRARPEPKPPEEPPATEPTTTSPGSALRSSPHQPWDSRPGNDDTLGPRPAARPTSLNEPLAGPSAAPPPITPVFPAAPAGPAAPAPTGSPAPPATFGRSEPAAPSPGPAVPSAGQAAAPETYSGRRRRQAKGPERPGRVDVGDVSDLSAHLDRTAGDPGSGPASSTGEISSMWSELIDPSPTPPPSASGTEDPDGPLLDDTTLGGRRAKGYDMQEDIDEITEGGGGVYRGRRARRRPDSA